MAAAGPPQFPLGTPPSEQPVAVCIGSECVTRAIRVGVEPKFLPDESDPHERRFLFSYRIRITNESDRPVQLIARHWVIVDAHGRRDDVAGEGVVGRQPALQPGQAFAYESFCPLGTHWGTMEGTYQFRDLSSGELFNVDIKRFHLVASPASHTVVPTRLPTNAGGA